jgi:hypothetical protein
MAFVHGKNAVFSIDNAATSLTDITAYVTGVDFPRTADTAETSVFGVSSKTYVVGLKDATISIEGVWDPTVDAVLDGILGTVAGSFEYGPEGDTAADIKYTGECICTAYSPPATISDAGKFSATFQVTGDVTRGTYT